MEAGPAGAGAVPTLLGLDEAGRGSLVGPLVVGGFVTTPETAARLPGLGVRDSKLLSPERREAVYAALRPLGRCLSIALSPRIVDRSVRAGWLNALEARAFAGLVARSGASRAFVDACDPVAPRFGRTVARLAGGRVPVHAQHRADREIPVVAAASIVAKVRRDRAIARLARSLGDGLGSGYPSDARTRAFVRERLEGSPTPPPWVRASWRTMETLKARPTARTLESFP